MVTSRKFILGYFMLRYDDVTDNGQIITPVLFFVKHISTIVITNNFQCSIWNHLVWNRFQSVHNWGWGFVARICNWNVDRCICIHESNITEYLLYNPHQISTKLMTPEYPIFLSLALKKKCIIQLKGLWILHSTSLDRSPKPLFGFKPDCEATGENHLSHMTILSILQ